MPSTRWATKQRSYTTQDKREALRLAAVVGAKAVATVLGYPPHWVRQHDAILRFRGAQTSKSLKDQGREEMIPFAHGLLTFMKDVRREGEVS
ncbi:hypothetical protein PHMEG_00019925 [Phytophthora megakarya]|uniref:Uncharacterized protein n=1 Tax=Phytophthora megakarya TaxID=4795 RepID=A0A225VRY0_9STRA|nr:hypothetical protein PHMEG_00019925 [Phytophthora megakarya]